MSVLDAVQSAHGQLDSVMGQAAPPLKDVFTASIAVKAALTEALIPTVCHSKATCSAVAGALCSYVRVIAHVRDRRQLYALTWVSTASELVHAIVCNDGIFALLDDALYEQLCDQLSAIARELSTLITDASASSVPSQAVSDKVPAVHQCVESLAAAVVALHTAGLPHGANTYASSDPHMPLRGLFTEPFAARSHFRDGGPSEARESAVEGVVGTLDLLASAMLRAFTNAVSPGSLAPETASAAEIITKLLTTCIGCLLNLVRLEPSASTLSERVFVAVCKILREVDTQSSHSACSARQQQVRSALQRVRGADTGGALLPHVACTLLRLIAWVAEAAVPMRHGGNHAPPAGIVLPAGPSGRPSAYDITAFDVLPAEVSVNGGQPVENPLWLVPRAGESDSGASSRALKDAMEHLQRLCRLVLALVTPPAQPAQGVSSAHHLPGLPSAPGSSGAPSTGVADAANSFALALFHPCECELCCAPGVVDNHRRGGQAPSCDARAPIHLLCGLTRGLAHAAHVPVSTSSAVLPDDASASDSFFVAHTDGSYAVDTMPFGRHALQTELRTGAGSPLLSLAATVTRLLLGPGLSQRQREAVATSLLGCGAHNGTVGLEHGHGTRLPQALGTLVVLRHVAAAASAAVRSRDPCGTFIPWDPVTNPASKRPLMGSPSSLRDGLRALAGCDHAPTHGPSAPGGSVADSGIVPSLPVLVSHAARSLLPPARRSLAAWELQRQLCCWPAPSSPRGAASGATQQQQQQQQQLVVLSWLAEPVAVTLGLVQPLAGTQEAVASCASALLSCILGSTEWSQTPQAAETQGGPPHGMGASTSSSASGAYSPDEPSGTGTDDLPIVAAVGLAVATALLRQGSTLPACILVPLAEAVAHARSRSVQLAAARGVCTLLPAALALSGPNQPAALALSGPNPSRGAGSSSSSSASGPALASRHAASAAAAAAARHILPVPTAAVLLSSTLGADSAAAWLQALPLALQSPTAAATAAAASAREGPTPLPSDVHAALLDRAVRAVTAAVQVVEVTLSAATGSDSHPVDGSHGSNGDAMVPPPLKDPSKGFPIAAQVLQQAHGILAAALRVCAGYARGCALAAAMQQHGAAPFSASNGASSGAGASATVDGQAPGAADMVSPPPVIGDVPLLRRIAACAASAVLVALGDAQCRNVPSGASVLASHGSLEAVLEASLGVLGNVPTYGTVPATLHVQLLRALGSSLSSGCGTAGSPSMTWAASGPVLPALCGYLSALSDASTTGGTALLSASRMAEKTSAAASGMYGYVPIKAEIGQIHALVQPVLSGAAAAIASRGETGPAAATQRQQQQQQRLLEECAARLQGHAAPQIQKMLRGGLNPRREAQ